MFNTKITTVRNDIANLVNGSGVPPSVLLVIFQEFAGQMERQAINAIAIEQKQAADAEKAAKQEKSAPPPEATA